MNKALRISLKVVLWIIATVIIIALLIVVAINIPAVQNMVKNQAVNWLKRKTNTEVRLARLSVAFPKDIVLEGLYLEDKKHDTLVYAGKLTADINLFKILKNSVELKKLELEHVRANVTRNAPDTIFNYQFLADAFAGEQKKPDTSKKESNLKFALDKLQFTDVGVRFKDDVVGNDAKVYFGNFDARVTEFDLKKQRYGLNRLWLEHARINYLQQKPMVTIASKAVEAANKAIKENPVLPVIAVADFKLNTVAVDFNDRLSNTDAALELALLGLKGLNVNLNTNSYTGNELRLEGSRIRADLTPAAAKASAGTNNSVTPADTLAAAKNPFNLAISKILLAKNAITYNNRAARPVKGGMDYNHLAFTNLGILIDSLAYKGGNIGATVKSATLAEKSGFRLNELKVKLVYNTRQVKLQDLRLLTPHTTLNGNATLDFKRLGDITTAPAAVRTNIKIHNTKFALRDLQYFTRAVPASYLSRTLGVQMDAHGTLGDLTVPTLKISGLKQTLVDITGRVKNVTNVKQLYADVIIHHLNTGQNDLRAILPANTLPANLELPGIIRVNGNLRGSLDNFATRLNLATDMGSANVNSNVKGLSTRPAYTAKVVTERLNLGRLLKNKQLGLVTANIGVTGSGKSAKDLDARFDADIQRAYYNNYTYHNIKARGRYVKQSINATAESHDKNANLFVTLAGKMGGSYPAIKAHADIRALDLHALNFYRDELKAAGVVDADFSSLNPNYLNGTLKARGLQFAVNGDAFVIDTISLDAVSRKGQASISLRSDIADATIEGDFQPANLGKAITKIINRYYAFGQPARVGAQRADFMLAIKNPKYIMKFVPALKEFAATRITGSFNTATDSLALQGTLPHVRYNDIVVDTLAISAHTGADSLIYGLSVQRFASGTFKLFNSEVKGGAANNLLATDILLRDRAGKTKYEVGGLFKSLDKTYQFSLDPAKLMLDYEKWQVAAGNYLQFGKAGVLVHNLELHKNDQALKLYSEPEKPNAAINAIFTNFKIETLTKLAEQDTALAGGTINGTAKVMGIAGTPTFNANLKVTDLSVKESKLGTLALNASSPAAGIYNVDADLAGVHNVRVTGSYNTKNTEGLDFKVLLNKIDLAELQKLTNDAIRDGRGTLTGNFDITGSVKKPAITGKLNFNNAGANVKAVNSFFDFGNQTLTLRRDGIHFDSFTIKDSVGQPAVINGDIYLDGFTKYKLDLRLKTNNFRLMNSTAQDNNLFYGQVYTTTDLAVKGDQNRPNITGTVRVNDNTKFFFALPDKDPAVVEQQGIVEFYDADATVQGHKELKPSDTLALATKGIDVNVNVNIDNGAELNVVVDPANGDILRVKGRGELNFAMDQSGRTNLTGTYALTDGGYNLTVGGLARREFKIKNGSTITWTGQPTSADVNITATYTVNAAPIDLLANQLEGLDQVSRNQYKQKFPFTVDLVMTGELMKPNLEFLLGMREQDKGAFGGGIWTKLQQVNSDVNERNKQTFALLALERFISENPFESLAGGTSVNSLARQSVSRLLTQQLNNLAGSLIQGVDVDFGVTSGDDYSTGTRQDRTTLDVALSKRLLNDRLTITVGSSFGLEGPQPNNGRTSNIAGDISIEYLLSKDGRYRLRAYRRNQTDAVLQGYITETGIGFSLVVDYNRFRDIFRKLEREQRNRRNEREKKK